MVAMRDGTRLNTFVFLPGNGGPRWPVILHRTPYGTSGGPRGPQNRLHEGVAAEPRGTAAGFDPARLAQHRRARYAAVYQDTRGRHGSEGEDRSMPMTPPMGEIRWTGLPASP